MVATLYTIGDTDTDHNLKTKHPHREFLTCLVLSSFGGFRQLKY